MSAKVPGDPAAAPEPPRRRNWLRRRIDALVDTLDRVAKEPKSIGSMARESALEIWGSRGGGFYGLGYLITFVVLEIRMFGADVATSDSVIGFLGQELLTLVFRFAFQSILNGLLALLWPAFVLQALGAWGIVMLAVGWWSYGRWAAPWFRRRGIAPRSK